MSQPIEGFDSKFAGGSAMASSRRGAVSRRCRRGHRGRGAGHLSSATSHRSKRWRAPTPPSPRRWPTCCRSPRWAETCLPLTLPSGRRGRASRGLARRRRHTLAGAGDVLARCRRVAPPRRAVYTSQAGPRQEAVQAECRCWRRLRDRPLLDLPPKKRSQAPRPRDRAGIHNVAAPATASPQIGEDRLRRSF